MRVIKEHHTYNFKQLLQQRHLKRRPTYNESNSEQSHRGIRLETSRQPILETDNSLHGDLGIQSGDRTNGIKDDCPRGSRREQRSTTTKIGSPNFQTKDRYQTKEKWSPRSINATRDSFQKLTTYKRQRKTLLSRPQTVTNRHCSPRDPRLTRKFRQNSLECGSHDSDSPREKSLPNKFSKMFSSSHSMDSVKSSASKQHFTSRPMPMTLARVSARVPNKGSSTE